jgi:predicted MFS family arabinose efflux permease
MDGILLVVFGTLSILGLTFGSFCTWMAVRIAKANKKDADVAMALWSMGSVAGFAVGSMSFAYFVLPIIWDRL